MLNNNKPGTESYKNEEYEFVKETIIDKKSEYKNSAIRLFFDFLCIVFVCVVTCFIYFKFFDDKGKNKIRDNGTGQAETLKIEEDTTTELETNPNDDKNNIEKTILSYMIVLKNYNEASAIEISTETSVAEEESTSSRSDDNAANDAAQGEKITHGEGIVSESQSDQENQDEHLGDVITNKLNKYIGVVIYKDSNVIIAANSKDVDEENKIYAEVNTGTEIKEVPVRIIATEEEMDITFLCIDGRNLNTKILDNIHPAKMAQNVDFEMGAECIYSGYVKDAGIAVSHGNVLSDGDISCLEDIEFTRYVANVNISNAHHGYIFTMDGKLAGICSSVEANISTVTFIDISAFKSMVQNIAVYGYTTYIGIVGQQVDNELEMLVGMDLPKGIFVTNVEMGSPAYYAGIGVGDIIYKVDKNTVTTMNDIRGIIDRHKLGDVIEIEINRYMGDRFNTYTITVQLGMR